MIQRILNSPIEFVVLITLLIGCIWILVDYWRHP